MTDEERAREFLNGRANLGWKNVAALIAAVRAEEREAMRAKCEAIARKEMTGQWPEWDMRVRRIADAIAALKDKPWVDDSNPNAAVAESSS